jgi:hypothetical protein
MKRDSSANYVLQGLSENMLKDLNSNTNDYCGTT